jgi:ketosteroid isomerase-like protein
MSQENVAVAWQAVEAFNRTLSEGTDDYFEFLDEEVEWLPFTALLDGAAYRGRDGVRKWMDDFRQDWEVYEVTWEEVRGLDDDRVLASGSWHAQGRRSGVELHFQQATWLLHFRNGKVTRLQAFTDRKKAIDAAGLRE